MPLPKPQFPEAQVPFAFRHLFPEVEMEAEVIIQVDAELHGQEGSPYRSSYGKKQLKETAGEVARSIELKFQAVRDAAVSSQ